jgi:hypothetical protein
MGVPDIKPVAKWSFLKGVQEALFSIVYLSLQHVPWKNTAASVWQQPECHAQCVSLFIFLPEKASGLLSLAITTRGASSLNKSKKVKRENFVRARLEAECVRERGWNGLVKAINSDTLKGKWTVALRPFSCCCLQKHISQKQTYLPGISKERVQ